MIQIIRTNSDNKDFIALVKNLDAVLAESDGEEHGFYDQFNKISTIKFAVVVYEYEKDTILLELRIDSNTSPLDELDHYIFGQWRIMNIYYRIWN